MSLKGNIETFGLSSILQMLNYEKRTGKLGVKFNDNSIEIFLHEGDIVFATETKKNNRLGELLKESGYISRPVLEQCLALGLKSKDRLGKILVQQGYITHEKLNEFLLMQAENTVYNVLLRESGEFEYKDAKFNMKGAIEYKFDTMFILLEASRRIDEIETLKKEIPDESFIPKVAGHSNTGSAGGVVLKAEEKRILAMIDGKSTVRQIFDKSGLDDFTGYKILNSLICAGAIDIRPPLTPTELAKEVVRQTSEMDSRQFRRAMDRLGLQRSCILRVALTRIFRDAVDEQQVKAAVKKEAHKIGSSPKKDILNKLREENQAPYMKDIIELLWQSVKESSSK